MATDAQIMAEAVWKAEYTPDALKAFGIRVGQRLGCTVYYKGNTAHLKGRHRSRNWSLRSAYCTNRAYGTTNAKDKAGPGNALRACDVMISGDVLEKACRGIDEAVRAGRLPELAEWFGTFDSRVVVGWYEGHASSSDTSHLTHLHLGAWTQFVDSADFWDRLYDAMMTYLEDDMNADQSRKLDNVERILTTWSDGRKPFGIKFTPTDPGRELPNPFLAIEARDAAILIAVKGDADTAAILAGVDTRLAQLRAGIVADVLGALPDGPVTRDDLVAALTSVLGAVDGATPGVPA